jgi:BirA family transcriptional regulator, biotin operon repressor / biotin---[acetyl-CoA-carboxylase] ligase
VVSREINMKRYSDRIIEMDCVDSTNNYATSALKDPISAEGKIIWSHEQTDGKGQGENKWISEPGKNLTISMILYPRFLPVESQFLLNKSVSLAVLDFVHTLLPAGAFKIKWPNDIYSGNLKLGGILIHNTISGSFFDASIIGIGVNINQTRFDPALPNPVSIRQLQSVDTDIGFALRVLIGKLDQRYDQLKKGYYSLLDVEYRKHLLGIDEERNFTDGIVSFNGFIRDVDIFGHLIIETTDNRKLIFSHKEIDMLF